VAVNTGIVTVMETDMDILMAIKVRMKILMKNLNNLDQIRKFLILMKQEIKYYMKSKKTMTLRPKEKKQRKETLMYRQHFYTF